MSKAVSKKEDSALAVMNDMLADDAGAGYGNASAECFAVPFIRALQSNSPSVDPEAPEYNPEHKVGMLYNTATGRAYDGKVGLRIIPCEFKHTFIEWVPRSAGAGSFVAEHEPSSEVVGTATRISDPNGRNGLVLPNGNDLRDTRMHYVLFHDPDSEEWLPAVLSLSSTQIKKSKRLLALANARTVEVNGRKIRPATYAFEYTVTTVAEENAKGKFRGYRFEEGPQVTDPNVYLAARKFAEQVRKGEATAQHEADTEGAGVPDDLDNDVDF